MTAVLLFVFWLSLAVLAYVFGGFGLLVGLVGLVRRRDVAKRDVTPKVSLIIAAYNEEDGIEAKIRNSLELSYPREQLEIIVGSDGSDDATEEIVARFADQGVMLFSFARRGKIFVLDELVSASTGDVLVFSDANTLYDSLAIRKLVRNFADPTVGGVCGNQKHSHVGTGDSSVQGEGLYWKYDKWLKVMESNTGSIVSADGAMYAIRRDLYRKPVSAAVTDDFFISTGVIEKGHRLVFESDAVGYEPTTGKAEREFSRKVRIMNRGLNGVFLRRRLLNPFRYGFYSLVLFSHKVLRRFASVFLLLLLGVSAGLADSGPFYSLMALGQVLFYSLAGCGYLLRSSKLGRKRVVSTPFFFCLANGAALVACTRMLAGKRIERWDPARQGIQA